MLTYQQALELKRAGFPWNWQEITIKGHETYSLGKMVTSMKTVPRLEDLINACGPYKEAPENLSPFSPVKGMAAEFNLHASLENGKVLWHASYFYPHHAYDVDVITSGDTPEIAVAKLYLAINKK